MRYLVALILSALISFPALASEELKIIGFNVESGWRPESDLETIKGQISSYTPQHIWGFSEVSKNDWPEGLAKAAGPGFKKILGTTSSDRLLIVFDAGRLALNGSEELKDYQYGNGGRAPLIAEFTDNLTGVVFKFMVNHLHRGNGDKRLQQAEGLNAWVRTQAVPIIAVGDYNFDFNLPPKPIKADAGYHAMIKDGAWLWVTPDILVSTQCDPNYKSVLDFAFVAGGAKLVPRESYILETDDEYCHRDESLWADHRPVALEITLE